MNTARLTRRALDDDGTSFEVLILEPAVPRVSVLFGVGSGGDPERHLPLLQALAAHGCVVIAPHFERLTSPVPSAHVLEMRARRLRLAFDGMAHSHLPAAGVGHSIGATLLLMLAGATASTMAREVVSMSFEHRLERLALMAPATDFFRAPGALRGVTASIAAWAGTRDEITPLGTVKWLENALHNVAPVEVRAVTDADHFSFMNAPPPNAPKPMPLRDAFLERLAVEVAGFIMN